MTLCCYIHHKHKVQILWLVNSDSLNFKMNFIEVIGAMALATILSEPVASYKGNYLEVYPNATRESTSLYFGLMLSLSSDHQSTGALAGVQAALDDINSRDDLLPGYSLHYTLTDSKVICRQLSPGVSFVM